MILTIGDELLIGQTIDTNSAWMGQQLNALGIPVIEKIAVSDSDEGITSGMRRAIEKADIILITGGLGPTKDDITKKVMAKFFNMGFKFDQITYDRIVALMNRINKPVTKGHEDQCYMPDGAKILENGMGTAPGLLFEQDDKILVSMPGVPYEMKYLMETHVLPLIEERYQGQVLSHFTLMTSGEAESSIAMKIEPIVDTFPDYMSFAYLPSLGNVRLRLTAAGEDKEKLSKELEYFAQKIEEELGDIVYGYNDVKLEERVGELALERGLTLGTAESCTGGKVASMIVNIAGSSRYFQGSLVTYSNELKKKILGVKQETLESVGAVSEEVVIQMVKGACDVLGVDVAVSISGIAGPSGGTPDKPVGTIWMACGSKDQIITQKLRAGKDREKNIEYASNYALNLMRKFLIGQYK